jgi:hypothetical protein
MKDGADRRPRATIDLVVRVDIRARLCLNVPEGTDFFCWKSSLAIRMPSNDSEVANPSRESLLVWLRRNRKGARGTFRLFLRKQITLLASI